MQAGNLTSRKGPEVLDCSMFILGMNERVGNGGRREMLMDGKIGGGEKAEHPWNREPEQHTCPGATLSQREISPMLHLSCPKYTLKAEVVHRKETGHSYRLARLPLSLGLLKPRSLPPD